MPRHYMYSPSLVRRSGMSYNQFFYTRVHNNSLRREITNLSHACQGALCFRSNHLDATFEGSKELIFKPPLLVVSKLTAHHHVHVHSCS